MTTKEFAKELMIMIAGFVFLILIIAVVITVICIVFFLSIIIAEFLLRLVGFNGLI